MGRGPPRFQANSDRPGQKSPEPATAGVGLVRVLARSQHVHAMGNAHHAVRNASAQQRVHQHYSYTGDERPLQGFIMPNEIAQKPTRQIARENELNLLAYLYKFGYLTHQQIAVLMYSKSSQATRLAQRLVKRMVDNKLLIRHSGGFGARDYIGLSTSGARKLSSELGMVTTGATILATTQNQSSPDALTHSPASSKDVMRKPTRHRVSANWAAIFLMRDGFAEVWTEREIQTNRAPFRSLGLKIPDTLAATSEGEIIWVEVEASRRGGRDLVTLAQWLINTAFPKNGVMPFLNPPADTYWLVRVRFVIAANEAKTFPNRLLNQIEKHLGGEYEYNEWINRVEFREFDEASFAL